MRWKEQVAHVEANRSAYTVLVGGRDRKRPLGKSRLKWKNNINTGI